MDSGVLEEAGLTKGESKAYLTLLELGPSKVGPIIGKTGLASSAVHNAIHSLIDKGLVSYIKKGKIKIYQAAPPKQLADFVEEKKKAVLQILPELELKQKLAEERQEAEVFEGTKGILAMLNLLIEGVKKGDEYYFFATYLQERNEEVQQFFRRYDVKRKDKGLFVRGIARKELKPLFEGRQVLHMKYPDFPIPSDVSICNSKVALIAWGDKPVGYLIRSPQIFEMFKKFFMKIWDSC